MSNPRICKFALTTAFATLALIGVGGLVTSHGVGLSVPDWPNTYGYNMFFFPFSQWVGGIFYEHSHRLIASGVGLLTAILALWLYGTKARQVTRWAGVLLLSAAIAGALMFKGRRTDWVVLGVTGMVSLASSFVWPCCPPAQKWLRRLGLAAFIGVVVQGVLGGLRVTEMKDELGIFHAILAQLFLVCICAIALFTSRFWEQLPAFTVSVPRLTAWLPLICLGLTLVQLALGATMRHAHAGLAIPDFPLAYGTLWPATDPASIGLYNARRLEITAVNPITANQVVLQMLHRFLAAGIFAIVTAWTWIALRRFTLRHPLSRLSLVWFGLILLQVVLGAASIWSNKAADIATGHVIVGALSLAAGGIVCIIFLRLSSLARATGCVDVSYQPNSLAWMGRHASADLKS